MTSAGQVVLGRLFPKTGVWAGVELSIKAAALTHSSLLSELKAVTLFDMTQPFEKNIDDCFYLEKAKTSKAVENHDSIKVFDAGFVAGIFSRINDGIRNDVGAVLALSGLIPVNVIEEVKSCRKQTTGKLYCIGELDPEELSPKKFIKFAEQLAAAYSLSLSGSLVVPYYLIKRN